MVQMEMDRIVATDQVTANRGRGGGARGSSSSGKCLGNESRGKGIASSLGEGMATSSGRGRGLSSRNGLEFRKRHGFKLRKEHGFQNGRGFRKEQDFEFRMR
ncbi:hypothetical protein EUGRSUZ_C03218 [Eucalyptus grandis]|uniref:Uncharacterized protein n=2 Tax=Eucalyptus grandis TaxID=71139 RepID=A0ACC3LHS4_EUCGR|nr:hypothetical protein EUGRSUZ_C03218 [Eucalyptus grandis]